VTCPGSQEYTPDGNCVKEVEQNAIQLRQDSLVVQHVVDHHQPFQQRTLNRVRWLGPPMAEATDNLDHDSIRNFAGRI
jgi:hypothetical protein